jgi:hypothetical protein
MAQMTMRRMVCSIPVGRSAVRCGAFALLAQFAQGQ